jgi:hypothetical protein
MTPRAIRRRTAAAFTLIELLVALVAGLVVALSIVTLSKEATRTFHEEVRSSAAEATLRSAVDRLNADLARAGFMSTGNILLDPQLVVPIGGVRLATVAGTLTGIKNLGSIRLVEGGSSTNAALSAAQSPALNPDMIEISGNMTSSEEFVVNQCRPPGDNAPGTPAVPATCVQIVLSNTSAAIDRINNGPVTSATADGGQGLGNLELRNLFQPVPLTSTTAYPNTQFIVRLKDATGHYQFLVTCPTTAVPVAGIVGNTPYVLIDNSANGTPILHDYDTGSGGAGGGVPADCAQSRLNAVQIVRWEITNPANEPTQYGELANSPAVTGADPNKYDLVRSFVDATDTVVPATSEVVAEYAVDLDFALSVDKSSDQTNPQTASFMFDDTGSNVSDYVTVSATATKGCQHIRSIHARVATRTAQADRSVNLAGLTGLYRYCLTAGGCTADGTLQWARARTITSEVSLPNQARDFW